jgi:hypothetical protein
MGRWEMVDKGRGLEVVNRALRKGLWKPIMTVD